MFFAAVTWSGLFSVVKSCGIHLLQTFLSFSLSMKITNWRIPWGISYLGLMYVDFLDVHGVILEFGQHFLQWKLLQADHVFLHQKKEVFFSIKNCLIQNLHGQISRCTFTPGKLQPLVTIPGLQIILLISQNVKLKQLHCWIYARCGDQIDGKLIICAGLSTAAPAFSNAWNTQNLVNFA